jgi:hypothetical protein
MRNCGLSAKQVYAINTGTWFDMGMCKVKLDFLFHDTPNSTLSLIYKDKSLFYATDTSRLDHIIAYGYDLYLIEANYDTDEELENKILEAKSKGEFTHLERVKHTHLSQLQALNWLDENMAEHSKYAFIHQHIER